MAWITVHNKILTTQQYGALPERSGVDLTTCLPHDVDRALSEGRTASMLTLDVKDAFDAVLPGRLARPPYAGTRLAQVPCQLESLLYDQPLRTKSPRWRARTSPADQLRYRSRLPRFSHSFHALPIPLFKMGSITRRFGDADDIAILETQKSLHDICSSLTRALKEALDWGLDQGITFDPAKAELQHFS
ncbi:hypothetical protein K3495_g14181 [Podosphaera aphanis]|nr:hypothetical protein K3495_g14181 [Podosphaera aphanis]